MMILWSFAITAGLLVLVYLMVAGVPHSRIITPTGVVERPRTGLPMLGACATGAGIAGYLSMGVGGLQGGARWAVIVSTAVVTALVTRWGVIKAFTEPPPDPEDDPRYRYQGHVGRITEAITAEHPGRVAFEADGQRFDLTACSLDGAPVAHGVEVVIERIDDDLATVELWATVEQRL
jgi:hypothetical protein